MKQIILSQRWKYSSEPFPAFWVIFKETKRVVAGYRKKTNEFFHIKGVNVLKKYSVHINQHSLYNGIDVIVANEAKKNYDKKQARSRFIKKIALKVSSLNHNWQKRLIEYFGPDKATIEIASHILPENNFRVVKVKKSGNYIVVPGRDETDGCLLFVGCDSEKFGEAGVCRELTTGSIVKIFHASLNNFSCIEVAVLLEKGQVITFSLNSPNQNIIRRYCWNGKEIFIQEENI